MRNHMLRARRAFSPEQLFKASEEGGFWDANDISTLFTDEAGLSAVATSGDRIRKWLDKSGNGNHLSTSGNTSDSYDPYYYDTQDGGPACSRPGSGSSSSYAIAMTTANTGGTFSASPPWTIAGIYAVDDTSGTTALFGGVYADSNDYMYQLTTSITSARASGRTRFDSLGDTLVTVEADSAWTADTAYYQFNEITETTHQIWVDTSSIDGPDAHGWTTGTITAALIMGLGQVDQRCHAFFAIDRVLSASEKTQLDTWMTERAAL